MPCWRWSATLIGARRRGFARTSAESSMRCSADQQMVSRGRCLLRSNFPCRRDEDWADDDADSFAENFHEGAEERGLADDDDQARNRLRTISHTAGRRSRSAMNITIEDSHQTRPWRRSRRGGAGKWQGCAELARMGCWDASKKFGLVRFVNHDLCYVLSKSCTRLMPPENISDIPGRSRAPPSVALPAGRAQQ